MEDEHRFLVKDMYKQISSIEKYHDLQIADEALFLAARIAQNPGNKTAGELRERFLDILIGAFCNARNRDSQRKELDKYEYNLRRAVVEYKQLVKEKNTHSSRYFWLWQVEKELKEAFCDLVTFMKSRMQVNYDDFVSCVHDAERIKDYSQILDQIKAKIHDEFKAKPVVGVREIAETASDLTGIPASWINTNPEERFMRLGERLKKRIVGQSDTVDSIVEALMKPKAGSSWRPVGLFLFAGPYGVGKAELAKAIANELYDDHLIQFDMGAYADFNSAMSLVGSLSEMVKKNPYSVVLFDQIEKAHSCVNDILASFLRKDCESPENVNVNASDFRNTLIIMTSDVEEEHVYELMLAAVFKRDNQVSKRLFQSELLNFLDKMIVIDWPCPLMDTTRLLLRQWACAETKRRNRAVIVCPSTSALVHIALNAARKYGETGKGLKRWVDQKVVFPMMSKMIAYNHGIAENITVYIDTIEEIGELSFNLKFD